MPMIAEAKAQSWKGAQAGPLPATSSAQSSTTGVSHGAYLAWQKACWVSIQT